MCVCVCVRERERGVSVVCGLVSSLYLLPCVCVCVSVWVYVCVWVQTCGFDYMACSAHIINMKEDVGKTNYSYGSGGVWNMSGFLQLPVDVCPPNYKNEYANL